MSTTPKRRGLASNRNVMGIYATMRQTSHPRIRDPARIWTWTRICVIVAPRESRILTWTWWSRRRSFCVANKLTRSALSRLHCRSCACVTVTHRRLFESFASRVERLRSIDLAVARTPARTCVSAIDPKASTESSRYQTSPLSLGSDHQSSREGTDCLPLHQSAIQKLPSSLIGLLSTPALETTRAFEHRSEFSLFSPPPAPCFQNHISCKATKAPADRRGLNSNLLCHFSHRPPTYGAILCSSSRPPAFSHPDSTIAPAPQASAEARTRWGVQLTCTTITDLSFCYL